MLLARDSSDGTFDIFKTPFFISPDTIRVAVDMDFTYKVEVNTQGNTSTPSFVLLPDSPNWVILFGTDLYLSATSTPILDTVQIQMKLDGFIDTLKIKITIYDPKTSGIVGIQKIGAEFGIIPQVRRTEILFTVGLQETGPFGLKVYDISGKNIWEYKGFANTPGYQKISLSRYLRNGTYLVGLQQVNKHKNQRLCIVR